MKNLDTYIEDLLFKHQCVIIPEFGAFVSNRKAAELAADKSFSPPQKELTFNSRLTYNDGLVAKHISEVERSSYEEAQEYIKSVVTRWKQELSLGQEVRLANIGKFTKGTDNNIIFTSLSKENYLTDSFGMSPVTTKEVSKGETGVEVANPIYNDQNNKPGLVENPSVTPEEAAAGKPKPKMPLPIKYAAVAIVGLSAIGYAVYSLMTNQENPTVVQVEPDPAKVEELVNQEVAKATYVPEIELTATAIKVTKDPVLVKKRKEELKKQAAERKKAQVAGTTDTPSTTTNTTTSEPTTPKSTNTTRTSSGGGSTSGSTKASGSFFLIAGAFSSESNAQNRVRQLKNSGYSTAGMVGQNEKGYYLVAYRRFSTRAQAESYMPEIKNKGLSTWIYPPAK
ncbi:SPOR domain-containing protein [Capnocytophaga gingivalis]|uniref:HU domain-containing protein n=1 Tax=Capnocytophaga gingivalis TaxID=1017 RepID=UPI0028EB6343|nr:SPOR domain-containing protein [Capnocytophaga gingivalis]